MDRQLLCQKAQQHLQALHIASTAALLSRQYCYLGSITSTTALPAPQHCKHYNYARMASMTAITAMAALAAIPEWQVW